jgi:hypothetical protein
LILMFNYVIFDKQLSILSINVEVSMFIGLLIECNCRILYTGIWILDLALKM